MASKYGSEAGWLDAIRIKRLDIQHRTTPGYFMSYNGPAPEAYRRKRLKELHRLRDSLRRIIAAGEPEWMERLDADQT